MRISRTRAQRFFAGLTLLLYGWEDARTQGAPIAVTLLAGASPSSGQPGVTSVSMTGSNFPAGTILPTNVTVTLTPASGAMAVTTSATSVATVAGTTRRVSFTIPATIQVAIPTAYNVGISGTASSGAAFASSNTASLTINPGALLLTVTPSVGRQGQQNLMVTLTGQLTNFVTGSTQASFGAGIAVGVASEGSFGPVTVVNATTAMASLTLDPNAAIGTRTVNVQTGAQQVSLPNGFTVQPGIPIITSVSLPSGPQGQTLMGVAITGSFTHFTSGTPTVTFSNTGITATNLSVTDNTHLAITVIIAANAAIGPSNVKVVTGAEAASGAGLFNVTGAPTITLVNPASGQQGQMLPAVTITGSFTHFTPGTTVPNFATGITVNNTTVIDTTHAMVGITIAVNAPVGMHTVTMTTGSETATLINGFSVTTAAGATITDFNPKTGSAGMLVTVTGTNLQPNAGTSGQFTLAKQGGGTLTGFVSAATATSVTFVVPAGAATGIPSVTVNSQNVSAATALTIVPSSTFSVNASPGAAKLIQGQSVGLSVGMIGTSGFDALAALSVAGVPSGVTAAFNPPSITAGQTSILTLTAAGNQPIATSALSIAATASVNGLPVTQTAAVSVSVTAPTTSFLGRTVVSDSLQSPLAGVTVTMLGLDGNGNTTGCTGGAVSDAGGNFLLANLPPTCVGPQLVGFNGTTATSPPGIYAGVNLVFTFISGQVTASPVLVHLPRIDTVETFLVTQNSSTNQTHSFTSIPGLSVTVYAGTKFTMADGTQPNPFPLAAVQVPVDRLPDAKPQVPTMMRAFIVAFQPANATSNEPVAVYFPNTLSTPPATDMALMTLDPTHGQMVPYGTGAVSSDGTQIVPDPDPAHPGHLYGLIHFDWHGPMPPPAPGTNPGPPGGGSGPCSPTPGNGWGPGGPGSCLAPPFPSLPTPSPLAPPLSCGTASNKIPSLQTGGELAQAITEVQAVGPVDRLPEVQQATNLVRGPMGAEPPAEAGDPVDLFSGIMVITNVDIAISGSRGSISLVRTYRSLSGNPGPFGIGSGHNYSFQLNTASFVRAGPGVLNVPSVITLVMPDGNQFPLTSQPDGTFTNTTIPVLAGVVLRANAATGAYSLRWKNGTYYAFQTSNLGGLEAFLTTITDPNGNTVTLTLNPAQPLEILQITDPVGRRLILSYDSSNRITSVTDPIGRSVQYSYNSQGTLATVTDPAGGITRYAYDSNNNMIQVTDPRGIIQAQNTLDSSGRVIKQVRPDGGTLTFTYTLLNPLAATSQVMQAQVTDSQGVQAIYRFNPVGFVTDITATQGQTREMPRAAGTNLLTSVTEGSATKSYSYDANGSLLSVTDATGHTTQFAYEPVFNKVTSMIDPLGNTTRFTYDSKGNMLTRTDADGNLTQYQYDSTGLLTQSTDALQQKTIFSYDPLGNLTTVTDPLGNTTAYAYDSISQLVVTTDGLGRRTTFSYDPLGRLMTRTDAKAGVTTFGYDPNGNLLSIKDSRNNTTTFAYDVMNRLTTRTDALGHRDSRTYDTNGNMITFVDRRGQSSTFAYDNLNRLVMETYSDATVARTYDVYGRLAQVTDSTSGVFSFSYDLASRLLSLSNPNGTVNYTYDGRGAMASRQVAGQSAVSYTYDPAGYLASASLPQASANFTYNPRNQLSKISRLNGVSSTFGYDPDARLLTLTHAAGASTIDAESYTYDTVGNRAGHSTSIGQSPMTPATVNQYNVNNQLILFGSVPDSYDANGNMVQEGNSTFYVWDGRNRLKSITTAIGQTTTFTYDFTGIMIGQADSGTSLNLIKNFLLDSLTNVAYEAASDGTSYSVLSGRSIDSHLAIAQSTGQVQYGLTDAINSTVATTDQSGAIKSQFLYDPFGQTMTTGTYPFQFTGRTPVSGSTYYYRARFYSTQTGRFISEDPIGFAGGSLNLYAYVRNNPTRFRDPRGTSIFGTLKSIDDINNDLNDTRQSPAGNLAGALWDVANLGFDLVEFDLGPIGWIISGYQYALNHPELGSTWFNGWAQRAHNDLCPVQPPGTQGDPTGIFQ